jgi:hypothetical protein
LDSPHARAAWGGVALISRRELLVGSAGALLAGGFLPRLASAGLVDEGFRREGFAALLGQRFYLSMSGTTIQVATLVEVSEPLGAPGLEQFSIFFRLPLTRAPREGLHHIWNSNTGWFALYLNPVGTDGVGHYQQAVFSLLR